MRLSAHHAERRYEVAPQKSMDKLQVWGEAQLEQYAGSLEYTSAARAAYLEVMKRRFRELAYNRQQALKEAAGLLIGMKYYSSQIPDDVELTWIGATVEKKSIKSQIDNDFCAGLHETYRRLDRMDSEMMNLKYSTAQRWREKWFAYFD